MKIIVMSDLHIGASVPGMDPVARLRSGFQLINQDHADTDLVTIAGDLHDIGDDYSPLTEALKELSVPYALTLGNHDNRDTFATTFPGQMDENGYAQSAHDIGDYRVILLDSLRKGPAPNGDWGMPQGELCQTRLDWCAERLDEAKERPVVVVLHHHCEEVDTVVDDWRLQQAASLHALLMRHGNVRHIVSGHIHMNTSTTRDTLTYSTIAGGHTTLIDPKGPNHVEHVYMRKGPAVFGIVRGDARTCTIKFEPYIDDHERVS